ncbi:MAG: DEAD/DEAH box helicase [bacterium]|nr:DEAD/DEAH box helicase [bacterium]
MDGTIIAPGARILVRDAEWLVRRADRTSTGGQAIQAIGLSELVRDKEAVFLTEIEAQYERPIEILKPADTELVPDESSSYKASLLYIESLLRQTPPTDEHIYIGHKAAMDRVEYQFDPARQALKQPRRRILIADGVGLGKTLEAGILLTELIKRGRGKRILVLTVKSMMTQFQKELWSRFTIPLKRLDSLGIQRVRAEIPSNHNPFYYYDKAIISIDTLKQDREYRSYIEGANWDIIVVDEAHNVAERGTHSLRSRLAKLLARRSDTLIMLSATPHDGRARSFASLMNMLDPTAIADPDNYGPDDIKGLFIRRFKKDIKDQVEQAFKQRRMHQVRAEASEPEEAVFDLFTQLSFSRIDRKRGGAHLFKTSLEKALFSSPAACLQSIRNRIKRLEKEGEYADDIQKLTALSDALQAVTAEQFSRYRKCLELIREQMGWSGKQKDDRLVIFTERIETMRFLEEHLPDDLGLKQGQTRVLHGGMSDKDQQEIVEEFGKERSKLRLLIASDVASEGINLHYLSHRMIHFDIPWALMVFQQRNGRIDRYGQKFHPEIYYLLSDSRNEKIKGDMHILELLIRKDQQAVENIGDPSSLAGVFDIEKQEQVTAAAIEHDRTPEEFEQSMQDAAFDFLADLLGDTQPQAAADDGHAPRSMPSVFESDYAYAATAIDYLRSSQDIQAAQYADEERVDLTAPDELKERFKHLPKEAWPEHGQFVLTGSVERMKEEFERCRKYEDTWPRVQYLWELHPVVQWLNDKVTASFRRQQAPVIALPDVLDAQETIFLLSGLTPNRKGHPLIHEWFGVVFRHEQLMRIEPLEQVLERTELGRKAYPNPKRTIDSAALKSLLGKAIIRAGEYMSERRRDFEHRHQPKLAEQLAALETLRAKQQQHVEFTFKELRDSALAGQQRKESEQRRIDELFTEHEDWVKDTMTTEDRPYIQVVAVLQGESE